MDGYYVIANDYGKSEELNIVDGVLQGVSLVFHPNNNVYSETEYHNGKRHGTEKLYYPTGQLSTANTYRNGVLTGQSLSYHKTGQLMYEAIIEAGEPIEKTYYDLLGNITAQMFIRNSRSITQGVFNGKHVYEHIVSNYDDFEATNFLMMRER